MKVKFIGGRMHGIETDDFTHFPARVQIRHVFMFEVIIEEYILQDWFVGVGQPTIKFYGLVGALIDDLIEIGRKVMQPC